MRKILIGSGIVVALIVAAALLVPMLIPANAYIGQVAGAVKQATGRDLKIAGAVSFRLLPNLALTANGVSLSNAPGSSDADFVTINKLDVGLKLIPLLSHKIEVSHLTLDQPVIHLEVARGGQANWNFMTAAPAPVKGTPQTKSGVAAQLQQFSLGAITITNGDLTYLDATTNKRQELSKLNATLSLPSVAGKLTMNGSVDWNGKTVDIDLSVANLQDLLNGDGSAVTAKIESDLVKLSIDGHSKSPHTPGFNGKIDLSSPSIRNLVAWAGTPLNAPQGALGAFSLKSEFIATPGAIVLAKVESSLDALKATGNLTMMTNQPVPLLLGSLSFGTLDLNPYLTKAAQPSAAPDAPASAPATSAAGWSRTPIDGSALKAINTNLTLAVTSLKFQKIEIGQTILVVSLTNGKLSLTTKQLSLYGGNGEAHIGLDGSGPVLGFDMTAVLNSVAMEPLLAATIGVDRFSGTGGVNVALTSRGHNRAELVADLAGKGAMRIVNGAITGIDLVAIEHKPLQGLTENSKTAQTTFTDLSGSFTATSGVLNNQDMQLQSPSLGLTGKGTIDLFHRTINYRVTPALPAGIQGGKTGIYGTAVPIVIQGPWDSISYAPDVSAVIQQQAQQQLTKQLGKLGGNSKAGGLLKGLLGH